MARGGGRSSGGHSGGGRSSSHSGGGGSFGGRGFSSGRSSRPFNTGVRGRYGAPPPRRHYGAPPPPRGGFYGAPPPPRRRYYRTPYRAGGGCSAVFAFIIILVILIIVFPLTLLFRSISGGTTKSTVKRDKLDGKYVDYIDEWYDDQLGWLGTNNRTVIGGLEDFYKETGVQPYLCLVEYGTVEDSDTARDEYIENLYSELFTDEGHLLFCYFACENDRPEIMDGTWLYIVGKDTELVMDENAKDILESNFQYYYDDTSLDVDELFARTFSFAGESIMKGPVHMRYIVLIIVAIVAVVIIVALLIKWWKARTAQKNKEQEDLERMLDKPLETFGTDSVDELKNKYDDK